MNNMHAHILQHYVRHYPGHWALWQMARVIAAAKAKMGLK
jgi:hypothetical protein